MVGFFIYYDLKTRNAWLEISFKEFTVAVPLVKNILDIITMERP